MEEINKEKIEKVETKSTEKCVETKSELNQFSRTELIIGKDNIEKLNNSKVAIFGIGGVGSFVCEGLARAGIGNFILIDHDVVDITNLNRQIIATHDTLGKYKVDVMKDRILSINKNAKIEINKDFFTKDSSHEFLVNNNIDYIIDAIDTVSAKIELVVTAKKLNIPIISSMGTGNKLNPTMLEVSDIYKTEMCPLAKVMRKELRNRKIKDLKVVYSKEKPRELTKKSDVPGSISFVPSVAGMIIASEVVKDIIKIH